MNTQIGTFALVPRIVDAVRVPVIAAGGIVDRRGVVAALALGASAVQVGTAYLFTPEAQIHTVYRAALNARDRSTAFTNVFSGRPARGIINRLMRDLGAMCDLAPPFPTAADAVTPAAPRGRSRGPRRLLAALGRRIVSACTADARRGADAVARGSIARMEARVGIEPAYAALQAAA